MATQRTRKRTTSTSAPDAESPSAPFWDRNRLQTGLGVAICLVAVFLFLAMASYLSTWEKDQSKVLEFSWNLIFSTQTTADNHLGSLGALASHFLIYDLFGIAAFVPMVFFMAVGINNIFREKLIRTLPIFLHTIILLILIPAISGLAAKNHPFPFGGGMGNLLSQWLGTLLGYWGLVLLLTTATLSYLGMTFSMGPNSVRAWLKRRKEKDEDDDADIVKESIIPEETHTPIPHFEDDTYEKVGREEEDDEPVMEYEPLAPVASKSKGAVAGVELTIEEVHAEAAPVVHDDEAVAGIGSLATMYDPRAELSRYRFPTLDLLDEYGEGGIQINKDELERNKDQIIETLSNYNIQISKIKATVGPTVTLYEIVPAPGIKISRIKNLEDDVALSLAALGIRIIAPIPGKGTIGIEVPNVKKSIVSMKTLMASELFVKAEMDLPVALGKTISNENFVVDLAKMPHLLMAGATGQGKSVGLNALLVSLLYKKHPSELKFVLVDPKKVELTLYRTIENHFLAKLPGEEEAIITDTKKVVNTLNSLCIEMDQRYDLLKLAQVRHIKEYNQKFLQRKLNPQYGHRFMPYIVLIIDEFADLMMTAGKEIETPIARLAQLARAIGIHLVIATQRPSVNIITGTIKANFPCRVAFKVSSKIDSRTILDTGGADQLIGRGDMLISVNGDITRLQCPFVDTPEVERITDFIGEQKGYSQAFQLPEYNDPSDTSADSDFFDGDYDPLFEEAARIIVQHQQGSTSLIQRRLKLGYNRAGRLMDQLEAAGVVGPNLGSKAREVYVQTEAELERILLEIRQ
jgi:DNA segregation ATPase FtsK/SpoIIIE, S-DNA-T family